VADEAVLIIQVLSKQGSIDYLGRSAITTHPVSDLNWPIGEVLKEAGSKGVVLESEGQGRYALLPLDDDVIDLLIERSPRFRADCQEIRQRMEGGRFQSHEDVRKQLGGE
jgi:hypothetical protein